MTDAGQVLGSLPWISPEQARGDVQDIDHRADIYAIGLLLACVLDGGPPYPTTGSPFAVINHIVGTPAVVGRGRPAGRLDSVAVRCLEKRPADRYANAASLLADLQLVEVGRLPKRRVRRKWYLRAAGVTAMTTAALGTVAIIRPADLIPPPVVLASFHNKIGMTLVQIPSGRFHMGSPPIEQGRNHDERQKIVSIDRPFWLAVTETTVGQYRSVMGLPELKIPDVPVEGVSCDDAVEFCRRLSALEHRRYRLPSEAEWEYACRAGSTGPFEGRELGSIGWSVSNAGGRVHQVGQLAANPWGLYDMHGNVAEWCNDATVGEQQGVRGGAFDGGADQCRSASIHRAVRSQHLPTVGFRVAAE